MNKNIEILPSLLSMDFSNIEKSLSEIPNNVNILHLDIMDGVFVNNITFGPVIIKHIRKHTNKLLDAHLMIIDPDKYIDVFAKNNIDMISFHIETVKNPINTIKKIKSFNIKAGIAINPETSLDKVMSYIDKIDYILIMSVNPGFAGQSFIENVLDKVKVLSQLKNKYQFKIEIDGGINYETAKQSIQSGVDWLVSGSFLFNQKNLKQAVEKMKNEY